jgi:type II secretory pathway component GspD/PulD (secretin)
VTFDDATNTVFVQAAPGDMVEIANLIEMIDSGENGSLNDLRIRPLKFANSDDLSQILQKIINDGTIPNNTLPAATTGGPGAIPPVAPGGVTGGVTGAANRGGTTSTAIQNQPQGVQTKSTAIGLPGPDGKIVAQSGLLTDVHITSEPRTNSLIISSNPKTMELLWRLIDALDTLPEYRASVKVVTLRKADATGVATMLQSLFIGSTTTGTAAGAPRPPGTTGPTTPGGTSGLGTTGTGRAINPIENQLESAGTGLIDLRIQVDARTNSIILIGNPGEVDVILPIIYRLDTEVELRHNQVYHLRNAPAVDVANALNSFLQTEVTIRTSGDPYSAAFQQVLQQVVIVPEPITNQLLVSATDRYYGELCRLLQELDAEPPQVVIQVLIAEVDLSNTDEFGVEIGLQSPLLFRRGIYPADFLSGGSGTSVNFTAPTTGTSLLPQGVSVNTSGPPNPTAFPGFAFNQPTIFPGSNPVISPAAVGWQGLTSLGVGRVSPTSGIGGMVLSASSNSVNILVRALAQQSRIDVLSRPQVTTMDNQSARVFVGQVFPIVNGSNATATGVVTTSITPTPVGVQLVVTPRISPDGKVIMRVTPEVSSTAPTNVNLGNGVTATAINQQTVDTTVIAGDGETVALGGLITKHDQKEENKVPWLGDLPGVGALFRYRTQTKSKQELLIIMTPHIIRSWADADQILGEESRRIDWLVGDVLRLQGTSGMNPILPPRGPMPGVSGVPGLPSAVPGSGCTNGPSVVVPVAPRVENPAMPSVAPSRPTEIPPPRPLPNPRPDQQSQAPNGGRPASQYSTPPALQPGAGTAGPQGPASAAPASQAPTTFDTSASSLPPAPEIGSLPGSPSVTTITTPLIPVAQEARTAAHPR